ncbi:hypothetical protein [uncultured Cohaesibacter sp.]|uniref:hypothetical protein n=1 Tax=uncultured Cohaesibacter sp. TaxID=1002546 RepID=UPI00292D1098|nr:hypothetical protein [uncultured Cohaesibacter sp.]
MMRFMGVDKFDKSALKRQAHRDVQFDHKRRLSLLAQHEKAELRSLSHGIKQRDAQRQKPSRIFRRPQTAAPV